ncbi:proprotein convertase subtilisin/kexin type 1 inhibitor, like [Syngnathus typhle]|uniref:proprotein convertase subtilisin/kexin type 1 inhibitor, like n=1 Tax=Syngnathus typhle TaxID=161592 RepID=UPI002A6A9BFF|nr:proprotein convertase subtilisin/kexin type 1 inhibitor, like [Syngnathus typhle]
MASLGLLLLSAALLHATQCALAARIGVGRQNPLAYDNDRDEMMSQPAYYRSDGWSGPSLEQALQRLVERAQRREQEEEQRTASLASLLRLLAQAGAAQLVAPGDVQVGEGDFQGQNQGRGPSRGRPPATWWTPQVLQAVLDRMEPQVGGAQAAKTRLDRFRGDDYEDISDDDLRRLLARILPILKPDYAPSNRRTRRDLSVTETAGSAHKRSRRSLGDDALPPSGNEPLLRVKRLDEDEEDGQQLDTVANVQHGARRRRAALNHVLLHQIVNHMRK